MDGGLHHAYVAALVESIETRSDAFVEHLAVALAQRCWPAGTDCDVPRGAIQVSDGEPDVYSLVPPECTCHEGRCLLCN